MSSATERDFLSHVLVGFGSDEKADYWRPSITTLIERYEGEVPLDDVLEKLFDWDAVKCPVEVVMSNGRRVPIADRHAIVHSKTDKVFKFATDSYVIHQFHEWLLSNVARILDSELVIGVAGVLRSGGGAFVTVEGSENMESRNGIEIKPKLLAASSHDSKLATSYKMVGTILRCENMLTSSLWQKKAPWNNRHTLHSLTRLDSVREVLGIQLKDNANAMCNFVDSLAEVTVTNAQWLEIVEKLVPIEVGTREQAKARLENKRLVLQDMWEHDSRCNTWKGSGFGVFQVFNTHQLHIAGSPSTRIDRNMRNILSAESQGSDELILNAIASVTGTRLLS